MIVTNENFNFEDLEPEGTIFGKVPLWLIVSDCKDGGVRLYAYFKARFGGMKKGIFPSQETIAEALGISIRSVQSRISELQRVGALRVTRRGFNGTNFHSLAWDKPFEEKSDVDYQKP
jgi:hypothetical protein